MGEQAAEEKSRCQLLKENYPRVILATVGGMIGYAIPSIIYYALKPVKPDDKIPAFVGSITAFLGAYAGDKLGKWYIANREWLKEHLCPHYPEEDAELQLTSYVRLGTP